MTPFGKIVLHGICIAALLGCVAKEAQAASTSTTPDLQAAPAATPCKPGPNVLCLKNNRFKVTAKWRTPTGASGTARAVPLTADTGYFWFFQVSNVEFALKIVDGCAASNGRYWVFAGGLTNLQVDIIVEDTVKKKTKTYRNPQSTPFRPIQDVNAFAGCPRQRAGTTVSTAAASFDPSQAQASASESALELRQARFRVSATWKTASGHTGPAQAVRLTDETGYFWFFDPNNVEMLLKVLDGCPLSNRFWVFAGGLTNVAVAIHIEDRETGIIKTYFNPPNTPFAPIQDTEAFGTCTTSGLPPDPGAAGRLNPAGVDSDRDGVRDDLQRFIALSHPGSPAAIQALRQAAKTIQAVIRDSNSRPLSLDHSNQMLRDLECLSSIRPQDAHLISGELMAAALNTEQRGLRYLQFDSHLEGEALPLRDRSQWGLSCQFPLAAATGESQVDSYTESSQISCGSKAASIFFVNGVFTTQKGAQEALGVLTQSTRDYLPAEDFEELQFYIAHNPTYLVLDLWEAVKQRLENDFSRFYRFLSGIEPMPDFMQEAYAALAAGIDIGALLSSPTAQNHINLYQRELLEGRKVVLVPHSQGNFFANRAYVSLTAEEQRSTGIVSVANPDSRVADGRPYTTLTNDIVIRPIPGALPATTSNGRIFNFRDWTGHGFTESYLEPGSNSRARILGHIRNAIDTLEPPDTNAGDGVITVTLTWGDEPDVDLHVFEPDGVQVYYRAKQGEAGFLDVDDITSFGPEHYFVSCDTLRPGVYHVGVNYFRGSGAETANIQIQAGLLIRNFQVHLSNARGTSGDSSPIPVASIIVTGSSQDGFEFQIQ
ncbi:MAG TPA: hypothetical protein VF179_07900 [Thermoanaerobaculia bacterium]|nr:hypothetical protein [Thermoanaerobaculia bacterium]